MSDLPTTSGALSRPDGLDDDLVAPDLEAPDLAGDGPSPLDLLRKAAEEKVVREALPVWDVPYRDGLAVRYTVEGLDTARMEEINRKATNRKTGRVSRDKVERLILAHQAVELYIEGKLVTEAGRPITFGHPTVMRALGVVEANEAVSVFYGGPKVNGKHQYGFAVSKHALDLQIEAGMGALGDDEDDDEDNVEDPPTP